MKNRRKKGYVLGDLIVALVEEASKVTKDRFEREALVYAALKDLLKGKVQSAHPILLKS